ncbi:rod shape-determining protein RodA [Anaerotalea alkaliphila]|uniref:Rod shape-determining protein RodA n=1 Tax=Anaerotalea alkaliphila TaxID=2662126 RepID=A0A7X5HWH1_9FIRM|nr:rod shape-determining protein RodA [Anaerotalea alkaliphila]NDL67944.1 rod shape-determining protein RodA [Anaerotalea alkaliphila]
MLRTYKNYHLRKYDFLLILLLCLLAGISITAIGSATQVNSPDGTDYFASKQLVGYVSGLVMILVVSSIDYRFITRFYIPIYILNIALLGGVLLIGETVNGATRWINIAGFTIQPSEFSKLFMILFLAKYFDKCKDKINEFHILLMGAGAMAVTIGLIFLQPNLSTAIVMSILFLVMVFAGGISYKYIAAGISVAVPTFLFLLWYIQQPFQKLLKPYQLSRVLANINPEEYALSTSLQTNNSIQAIGSGQLFGKGLYLGKLNKYNYLPEPQTDFIFSIIGEEFGFVGCVVVLALLFLLIIRCLWLAKDAPDNQGMLIIVGFVALILFQTFINVGVTTGIVPNTGVTLPFVSYGLSSLWSNMIAIGIILNISMQRRTTY